MRYEKDASIAEMVTYSGVKTGRSPKDKRLVKHPDSERDVWWGTVNRPIEPITFAINRALVSAERSSFETVVSVVVADGRISRIYAIRNPHKLGRLDEEAALSR